MEDTPHGRPSRVEETAQGGPAVWRRQHRAAQPCGGIATGRPSRVEETTQGGPAVWRRQHRAAQRVEDTIHGGPALWRRRHRATKPCGGYGTGLPSRVEEIAQGGPAV